MKRAALLLLLLASVGCSSTQIVTDYDKTVDFSRYKTYAWIKGTEALNPLVEDRIRNAIEGQLAAKGLTKTTSSADLAVATHASTSTEKQIDVNSFGYGYGWGGWGGGGSTSVNVYDIHIGTLLVDLVDVSSNKLVWRGIANATVDKTVSQELVNDAAAKMFAKYPPPPGQ